MRIVGFRTGTVRFLLPVLALCLAGTVALIVYALLAAQEVEDASVRQQCTSRAVMAWRVRAARVRSGHPVIVRRGAFHVNPEDQAQVREMVAFCDTVTAADAPTLRKAALEAENPVAAANAIRALGRLRLIAKDAALLALLCGSRERVRDEVIMCLGDSGDPGVVPLLQQIALCGEPKPRLFALQSIRRIGGQEARAVLSGVVSSLTATREDRAFARTAAVQPPR